MDTLRWFDPEWPAGWSGDVARTAADYSYYLVGVAGSISRYDSFGPEYEARYRNIEPGRAGLGPQFQATVLNWDDRLPQNELVLGVNQGAEFRAYVLAEFGSGLQVLEDELGGTAIAVFLEPDITFGLAFLSLIDGKPLEFVVEGGQIVDSGGSIWDVSGKATSGPHAGSQLEFVTSFVTEWYGWAAYHPQTSIFGR